MKIFIINDDGRVSEAFQTDKNTFTFSTEDTTFQLSLSEIKKGFEYKSLTDKQKKRMTEAIFSNEEVIDQLREARKNRDKEFSYYSGDETEFNKLVDEVNN
ncbi:MULTISPECIES: hypothetical protein [Bacillaceae]|uniref:Uncharacterized protein n=1 Tax=Evansella alkalicola TaxID=745819 RepID=A0ABS6JSU7_9BACI|nr:MULTISPECIES: hypothetical protein [Bacillaceae]MBU9721644.1 hypothetical protein [Bacillus alkalicola]